MGKRAARRNKKKGKGKPAADRRRDSESESDGEVADVEEYAKASMAAKKPIKLADVEEVFQAEPGNPPTVAALPGGLLQGLDIGLRAMPNMIMSGLKYATRLRHLRALRSFKEDLPTQWWNLPLPVAAVKFMERQQQQRAWRDVTAKREMANLTGAFSNLQIYTDLPVGVELMEDRLWRTAMRTAEKRAKLDERRTHPAAKAEEVVKAMELSQDTAAVKVLLVLSWLFAGRVGDVRQLGLEELEIRTLRDGRRKTLTATFFSGKAVECGGQPYTLTTLLPDYWVKTIADYIEQRRKETRKLAEGKAKMLFPPREKQLVSRVKEALRMVCPDYSVRAIRRGALQAMGKAGVDLEIIRKFAGHRRLETTRRYLGWDKAHEAGAQQQAEAAENLQPQVADLEDGSA